MLVWMVSTALAAEATPGAWGGALIQADVPSSLRKGRGPRLWLDLHGRSSGAGFVGIARPAAGWALGRGFTVYAGYAWIGTVSDDLLVHEHRVWEQAVWAPPIKDWSLTLRPRLEQRFLDGQAEVAHRARLWGRVGVPLAPRVGLVVHDEVFVGLGATPGTKSGFDQNRLFLGPFFPLAEGGRVEVGYLHTFLDRDVDTHLHLLSTLLVVNL